MPKTVIADKDRFYAFLAAQPLCQWSAQKQHEIAVGIHHDRGKPAAAAPAPKDDNADLAAALSAMA